MLVSRFSRLAGSSRVVSRLASSQSALIPTAPNVLETNSGVKACLMESKVTDTSLSQNLKKDVTDISLVVKAGTRFESDVSQELGLAQALKTFSMLTHDGSTILRSLGTMELLGCEYGITVTRELIIYKLSCEQQYFNDVLPFLTSALSKPRFAKWELGPTKYQAKLDSFLFSQDPVAVTVDLLHKAAFRKGLGNSLTMTEDQVDSLNPDKLLKYHELMFSPSNAFLASNNAPQDLVKSHFENFGKGEAGSKSMVKIAKSEFISDEIRSDDNTKDSVVIAIARSSGPTNSKQAIIDSMLAHLLQGKQRILIDFSFFELLREMNVVKTLKIGLGFFSGKGLQIEAHIFLRGLPLLFGFYFLEISSSVNFLVEGTQTPIQQQKCKGDDKHARRLVSKMELNFRIS